MFADRRLGLSPFWKTNLFTTLSHRLRWCVDDALRPLAAAVPWGHNERDS